MDLTKTQKIFGFKNRRKSKVKLFKMTFSYGSTCFYSTFIIYYIFTDTIYVGMQKDGFDKVVHTFKNDLQFSGSGPGGPQ